MKIISIMFHENSIDFSMLELYRFAHKYYLHYDVHYLKFLDNSVIRGIFREWEQNNETEYEPVRIFIAIPVDFEK